MVKKIFFICSSKNRTYNQNKNLYKLNLSKQQNADAENARNNIKQNTKANKKGKVTKNKKSKEHQTESWKTKQNLYSEEEK